MAQTHPSALILFARPSLDSSVKHTLMSTPTHSTVKSRGVDFKAKDVWRIITPQGRELKFQPWEGVLACPGTPCTPPLWRRHTLQVLLR